jgi:hypothetical protein
MLSWIHSLFFAIISPLLFVVVWQTTDASLKSTSSVYQMLQIQQGEKDVVDNPARVPNRWNAGKALFKAFVSPTKYMQNHPLIRIGFPLTYFNDRFEAFRPGFYHYLSLLRLI